MERWKETLLFPGSLCLRTTIPRFLVLSARNLHLLLLKFFSGNVLRNHSRRAENTPCLIASGACLIASGACVIASGACVIASAAKQSRIVG